MHKHLSMVLLAVSMACLSACVNAKIDEAGIYRPVEGGALKADELAKTAPQYTMSSQQVIARDGAVLNGVLLSQENARATVLFFGGNGFTLEKSPPVAELFSDFDVDLVMFDTRGYGTSAAENEAPTVAALMTDGEDIFDNIMSTLEPSESKIIVHGHSMGSFVAGHVAATRPVTGVVLQSSATTTQDFAKGMIPWFMKPVVKLDIAESLKGQGNLKNMPLIDEPLLVIVGADDKQTVPSMSVKLFEASPLPDSRKSLAVIKDAGHNDIFKQKEALEAYETFLSKL